MRFSEDVVKKIKKENERTIILDILNKMFDYRISEYFSMSIAGSLCFDVFSKLWFVNFIYCVGNMLPFFVNDLNLTSDQDFYVEQYIKLTDEYKKISSLYNEYVTEVSKLINEFGNLDIYEIGLLYTIILKKGFLSKDRSFNYHLFKNDNRDIPDIFGARITSGLGVCRHEANLLIDIYNKLGYNAEYITCKAGLHNSVFKEYPVIFSLLKRSTHSIVNVNDGKEYLIFDPEGETVGKLSGNAKDIIESRKFCNNTNNILYYTGINNYNDNFINDLTNMPCYLNNISFEETVDKFNEINNKVECNQQDLFNWNNVHNELMEEISSLAKLLTGYSDDEIIERKRRI